VKKYFTYLNKYEKIFSGNFTIMLPAAGSARGQAVQYYSGSFSISMIYIKQNTAIAAPGSEVL
jgi:hypothetical protein